MRSGLFLFVSFCVLCCCSCSNNSSTTEDHDESSSTAPIVTPHTIIGFSSSEGITSDGKYFYVSNIGEELEPTNKDGDGFISRLGADGGFIDLKYISQLDGPKGMCVINNTLFVADVDRLLGFDLEHGTQKFELVLTSTMFLNAITARDDNTLFVTATDANLVFRINIANGEYDIIDLNQYLHQPNGICFDQQNDLLYVVGKSTDGQKGVIGTLSLVDNNRFTLLIEMDGTFDGLKMYKEKLIITDWTGGKDGGRLLSFDPATGETKTLEVQETMKGPAEFYIDDKKGQIWIPRLLESTVLVASIGS